MTRHPARVPHVLAVALLIACAACSPAAGKTTASRRIDPAAVSVPELVEIPQGPFTMGADPARDPLAFDNERWSPGGGMGTVDLPAFYIGRHEVTVRQFAAFVRATGWSIDERALHAPDNHPVTFVSWPDALAYCRWLEGVLPDSPAVSDEVKARLGEGWRVLLPSEAQWEKAARGMDARVFPWGAAADRQRANYERRGTSPVGSFPCPECPYGLLDMSGNVWEWTSSPYQPYPYDASDDLDVRGDEVLWVIRGGHFGDPARLVRTTARGAAEPGARRAFIGFRIVVTRAVSSR